MYYYLFEDHEVGEGMHIPVVRYTLAEACVIAREYSEHMRYYGIVYVH